MMWGGTALHSWSPSVGQMNGYVKMWYSFLTTCSFQLLYGKIYTFFPLKWVFFAAVAVFELGSVVCATAPTSVALIVGRGISGLGSAGINSGFIMSVMDR